MVELFVVVVPLLEFDEFSFDDDLPFSVLFSAVLAAAEAKAAKAEAPSISSLDLSASLSL